VLHGFSSIAARAKSGEGAGKTFEPKSRRVGKTTDTAVILVGSF